MARLLKPSLKVTLEIGHGKPTKAQIAAWSRAWRLLAQMPAPAPVAGKAEEVEGQDEGGREGRANSANQRCRSRGLL